MYFIFRAFFFFFLGNRKLSFLLILNIDKLLSPPPPPFLPGGKGRVRYDNAFQFFPPPTPSSLHNTTPTPSILDTLPLLLYMGSIELLVLWP